VLNPRLSTLVLCSVTALFAAGACKEKTPAPPPEASATAAARQGQPQPESEPTVRAYPPGVTPPPEAPKPAGVETKSGVCAFRETGYDGQDTKFSENLVVRIRDGRIVGLTYSYKGSYAQEAHEEQLDIPIREKEWATLKAKASSGPVDFKVQVIGDRFKMRGTAAQDGEGQCTWMTAAPLPSASASAKP
jgi:hypothetical protein